MAVPTGTPNLFERFKELWSVATVTSGTPPWACAVEDRSSAMPQAMRHMQIVLRAETWAFANRAGRGKEWQNIGFTPRGGNFCGNEQDSTISLLLLYKFEIARKRQARGKLEPISGQAPRSSG